MFRQDGSHSRIILLILLIIWLSDNQPDFVSSKARAAAEWFTEVLVGGFEDPVLFEFEVKLWTSSTVLELTEQALRQQVVCPLDNEGYSNDWVVFESHQHGHEKNWMPWVRNGEIQFVHRLGSMVSMAGGAGDYHDPNIDVSCISGGSQVCNAGGIHIGLVHGRPSGRLLNRYYQHRLWYLPTIAGFFISPPFFFHDRQIEFAAGLAYFPDERQLMVSYGVRDCEAWLATMDLDEVIAFIAEGS